jgi:hypothetical protein
MLVKVFVHTECDKGVDIEKAINDWLVANQNKVDVIDIKVAVGGNGATTIRTTHTILYKEKTSIS